MAKKYKVVIVDTVKPMEHFHNTLNKLLDDDVDIVRVDENSLAEVEREVGDCDGILVPLLNIGADLLAKMKKCKVIVKMGIGYDNIDSAAAAKLGIMVANIPDYCQGEVADHAMALFLALQRRVVLADRQVRNGKWNDLVLAPDTHRLSTRTFGLLGCGFIARECAARAKAFGMSLIGYDPFIKPEAVASLGIRLIPALDDFLAEADFISLHIPATAENRGLINLERLKKMKRSCLLVNTARGAVINETDLHTALKEGIIAGAAIDVQISEPPKQPSPFADLDNIIMTPHIGYYSVEADIALRVKAAEQIAAAFLDGRPKSWVNQNGFVARR